MWIVLWLNAIQLPFVVLLPTFHVKLISLMFSINICNVYNKEIFNDLWTDAFGYNVVMFQKKDSSLERTPAYRHAKC